MAWNVDTAHTQVAFAVRHLGVSFIRGNFDVASAELNLDEANPGSSSLTARIDTGTLNTHNPGRDGHLKTGDFFDVEHYPTMTFQSKKVTPSSDGKLTMTGDLTIKDVTREVELQGEYAGPVIDPVSSKRKIGFTLAGELTKTDWGIDWNVPLSEGGFMLGDRLTLSIDAQAIEA